jgi:hypothetical protein
MQKWYTDGIFCGIMTLFTIPAISLFLEALSLGGHQCF